MLKQNEFLDLAKEYKVDSVQELIDRLQTLAPINNLEDAKKAQDFMDSNGGLKEVNAMVEKFKEGQGKPPCVFAMENGLKVAKTVAVFEATNSSIRLISWQPEFAQFTPNKSINRSVTTNNGHYEDLALLGTMYWSRYPQCRYTVTLHERSKFLLHHEIVYKASSIQGFANNVLE